MLSLAFDPIVVVLKYTGCPMKVVTTGVQKQLWFKDFADNSSTTRRTITRKYLRFNLTLGRYFFERNVPATPGEVFISLSSRRRCLKTLANFIRRLSLVSQGGIEGRFFC